jgi:outer membrane protein assembly factor BamB
VYRYDLARSGFTQDRGPVSAPQSRWFLPVKGGVTSAPTHHEGMLFFGTGGGEVLCVDASSGDVRWAQHLGGEVRSTPAICGNVLVVGVHDGAVQGGRGSLAGLDIASGKVLWLAGDSGVTNSPLVLDGAAFVGSADGRFFAVDVSSGRQRWAAWTGGNSGAASLAAADQVLVVVSSSGYVHGFHVSTGKELWTFNSEWNESTPAIASGRVVYCNFMFRLICLDLQTGRELWSTPTGINTSSPAIHDGRVIVNRSREGLVAAYSLDSGQQLWTSAIEGDSFSSPTVTNDHVFVKGQKELAALRVSSGETVWLEAFPHLLVTSPVIAADDLFVGFRWLGEGEMHAFGPSFPLFESPF